MSSYQPMDDKNKNKTFFYKEDDIKKAIESVQGMAISDSMKSILIHCLTTCLSINALLQKNRSLRRLLGRLFGFKSEKKRPKIDDVLTEPTPPIEINEKGKEGSPGGHGKRGYQNLQNTINILHPHSELKRGDPCPEEDCDGKVYPLANPGVYVRITANEPITTTVHLTEKFRCNLCGKIFEDCPHDVASKEKYDESVLAHIIMHKCFYGVAQNRSATYGPLSASTLSELFAVADSLLNGVSDVLVKTIANDDQISFDDTKIKIQPIEKGGPITAWGSVFVGRDCIYYNFSRNHAGKVFEELLKNRVPYMLPPIVLTDALPAYGTYKKNCIDIHCLTHGRRRFKDAVEEDEAYCKEIIDLIATIYETDKDAKNFDDMERQLLHFQKSVPILNRIMEIIQLSIEEKRFMPNSEIGKALNYWDENFNKLSAFTRIAGVLLDTNHVERAVKAVIRIRKQAPIFKTEEGAMRVSRMLSLTETCLYIGEDPLAYLKWAIKGAREGKEPIDLTPWAFKKFRERERSTRPLNFSPKVPSIERPEFAHQMATN
jgi:hypothetical protein